MLSSYSSEFLLTPDLCGQNTHMLPLAAFSIFQNLACAHAEALGVGFASMADRGQFWLMVHVRADFLAPARLSDSLTGITWPEKCGEKDVRFYRSHRICRGEETVVLGRAEWAILGNDGRLCPAAASPFPLGLDFVSESSIPDKPKRLRDFAAESAPLFTHTVRASDIDVGHHMNNLAYLRLVQNCFTAEELCSGRISSVEAHYGTACHEGDELSVFRLDEDGCTRISIRSASGKTVFLALIQYR